MKKSLFLLALSAMVIGGCSKSEIDDGSINSTNAISFSTSANKLTKAAALGNDNATDFDFGVYAYQTGQSTWTEASTKTEFMVNQMVEYDGAWTYTPMKYWPNSSGEKISFFAYMPYSTETVASIPSSSTLPQIEFTQNMDAETMLDLTVAKALDKEKTTSAVELPFEHVTTRLNFSAKVDHNLADDLGDGTTSTYVYVSGLRILGSNNNSNSKLYSKATYVMSDSDGDNGEWDYTTTEPTVSDDDLEVTPILNRTDWNLGYPAQQVTSVRLNQNATATSLLATGEYLFLIPVDGDTGVSAETDIQLEVDYSIVTTDEGLDDKIAKSDATATMSLPNGTLKEGVAYNIVMTIGVDKVIVDAEADDDWATDETIYTESKVTTADAIEDALTAAFAAGQESVTVTYEGSDEPLAITIPDATSNQDMSITLDLTNVTGNITITTVDSYTGALYINAPSATVTINGKTYTNLTSETDVNTLIIAAGTTVDGLTINAGNVVVYGTLKGNITKSASNTGTPIITVMPGGICVKGDDTTIGEGITLNATPTDEGVYYSVDNGAWKAISELSSETTGTSIKVMGIGNSTLSYSNLTTIVACDFEEVDLGDVQYQSTIFSSAFRPSNAVDNPRKLRYISLPSNTESLPTSAFNSCDKLETIDIPSSLVTLNDYAFNYCTSLKSFAFNENTSLGICAFAYCTNLKVEGFENIISMPGYSTFRSCENLGPELVFNDAVTSLGNYAFLGCTSLTKVTLSESLGTMGDYIFHGCTNLSEINIPSGLTSMGTHNFAYTAINNSTWPCTNITEVPDYTFYNCPNITSFTIPETITELGGYAFGTTGITGTLTIPNSVNSIGSLCFYNSNNITEILFESGTNTENLVIYDRGLTNEYIEKITFPSGRNLDITTQSVDWAAFHLCYRLKEIVCPSSEVPAVDANDFGYIATTGVCTYVGSLAPEGTSKTLYVPYECKSKYESATMSDGTTENYWKTILQDKCGFKVEEITAD